MKATTASYRSPAIFSEFPELITAESTRHGGISEPPYHSLNLGLYTQDDPTKIMRNIQSFLTQLDIDTTQTAGSFQIHEDRIKNVQEPGQYRNYDALICAEADIYLTVTIADCTPILIYDPGSGVVAAVHAGWRGTKKGIAAKCIRKMGHVYGTNPADCFAYIGTCIDECSFEVGNEVADVFENDFKRWDEDREKFFIDLKKANLRQLTDSGVPLQQIEISPYSTVLNNEDYFSHRKENGTTGRMLALIGRHS